MFARVVDFESMTNNQTRVQLVIIRLILQLERCSWYHLKAYFMPIPRTGFEISGSNGSKCYHKICVCHQDKWSGSR